MKKLNAPKEACHEDQDSNKNLIKKACVVALLFLAVPSGAQASHCPDLLKSLHKAARDDYEVQLMTTVVNGRQKLVVLLGEAHIKSPASAAIGRGVLENFDFVGREGSDPEKTWGGRFSSKFIHPLLDKISTNDLPQFWFIRLIGKLRGEKGRTEGSTIVEAQVAELKNRFIENTKKMTAHELSDLIAKLEGVPENERGAAPNIEGVKLFSKGEKLEIAKAIANGVEPPNPKGPKETIHLEAGHVPDIWENIHSIESYATMGTIMGYYATSSFLPQEVLLGVSLGINALAVYQLGELALYKRFEAKRWYQRIFPISVGNLKSRNRTMVSNIVTAIESRSEIEELLVVVGEAHVPEMKRLLQQRGYSSLPLPVSEQMETPEVTDTLR